MNNDPQVATLEQKLSALFNYLENRCAMENAERLRPFPTDSQGNTALSIDTSDLLQITMVPRQVHDVTLTRRISKETALLLVSNPNLAVAVSGKIFNDCRAEIVVEKPVISDAEALLAGTAVMSFKQPGGKFLTELENGDFEYRCFSDCIPYPKAFLK